MPDSVANLLLRITGETGDAEHDLDELIAKLQLVDDTDADADVNADTSEAAAELAAFLKLLGAIDDKDVSADVNVNTGGAEAHLLAFQLLLSALDKEDIKIDVDVKTAGASAHLVAFKALLGALGGEVPKLGDKLDSLSGSTSGAGGAAGGAGKGFSLFGIGMEGLAAIAAALIPVITALVAAVTALVVSLGAALAALGALAVTGFAAVLAGIPLLIAGIQRFKNQMHTAGTAANDLWRSWEKFKHAFTGDFGPAVDPILRGMASALRSMIPLIQQLAPAFKSFGQGVGKAIGIVAKGFRDMGPQIAQFVGQLGPLAVAVANAFVPLIGALLNLANATLPLLIGLINSVADAFKGWQEGTSDVTALSGTIATLLEHLSAWFNLGKQIGGIFVALFQAIGPQALDFVNWLAKGAENIKKFIQSADGKEKIQKFFSDVLPLAKQLITFIGHLAVLLLQVGQAMAPAFTVIFGVLNDVLGVVSDIIQFLMPVIQFLLKMSAIALAPIAAFKILGGVISHIGDIATSVWNAIKAGANAVKDAGDWIVRAFANVLVFFATLPQRIGGWLMAIPAVILAPFIAIPAAIIGLFLKVPQAIGHILSGIGDAASGAFDGVKNAVGDVVNWITGEGEHAGKNFAHGVWVGLKSQTKAVYDAGVRLAKAAHEGLSGGKGGDAGAKIGKQFVAGLRATGRAAGAVGRTVAGLFAEGANSGRGAAQAAGHGLVSAVSEGIRAGAGAVIAGAKSVAQSGAAAFHGAASTASAAGSAMSHNFASGILSGLAAVASAASAVAAKARALLPGSEPKDHSSPLYGLGRAGEAFVYMFAAGITKAGPALVVAANTALLLLQERIDELQDHTDKASKAISRSLQNMIPRITNLADFQKVASGLRTTINDLVTTARDRWIDFRTQAQLAAVDTSPLGKELAKLTKEQAQIEVSSRIEDANNQITDLKQHLQDLADEAASPNRTRSLDAIAADRTATLRQITGLERDITAIKREARIKELQDQVDLKKQEVQETADLAKMGLDKEANAYAAHLNHRLEVLRKHLAKGEISYDTFRKAVAKLLKPLGLDFSVSLDDEIALRSGRGFIEQFTKGMKDAAAGAKSILRGILKDLRDMLPGSEPRDRNSPIYGLRAMGEAMLAEVAAGLPSGGRTLHRALQAQLAGAAVNLALPGGAEGLHGGITDARQFTLQFPPAPAAHGMPDAEYIGSQVMDLIRDNGGL